MFSSSKKNKTNNNKNANNLSINLCIIWRAFMSKELENEENKTKKAVLTVSLCDIW